LKPDAPEFISKIPKFNLVDVTPVLSKTDVKSQKKLEKETKRKQEKEEKKAASLARKEGKNIARKISHGG
jgi:hypothetical protein